MNQSEFKHTVYVQKIDRGWACGYLNRKGKPEAERKFDTLKEAREHASSVWGDVYHGTNICLSPARPKTHPEEYPNLPLRPDGSSAVELILPHSKGYHIDGKPKIIVSLTRNHCWLDEDKLENKERILLEVIRDLEKFSNEKLEKKLNEKEEFFYKKIDEEREKFAKKIEEDKTQVIKDERQLWVIFFAPLVACAAFFLGRVSVLIF